MKKRNFEIIPNLKNFINVQKNRSKLNHLFFNHNLAFKILEFVPMKNIQSLNIRKTETILNIKIVLVC